MLDDMLGPGLYTSVRLSVDRETQRSRGFCHVEFINKDAAERAVSELNDLEVLGRQIRVDFADQRARRNDKPSRNSDVETW
jgi:RNA recognition motif-containing protein